MAAKPSLDSTSACQDSFGMFRASECCSICLDDVVDSGEHSITKLKCGHYFHLYCIVSAFHAKGARQCPNCRNVEGGPWLFPSGPSRGSGDISIRESAFEPDRAVTSSDDDGSSLRVLSAFDPDHESFEAFFAALRDEWNRLEQRSTQQENLQAGGSSDPHFEVSRDSGIPQGEVAASSHDYHESLLAWPPDLWRYRPAL